MARARSPLRAYWSVYELTHRAPGSRRAASSRSTRYAPESVGTLLLSVEKPQRYGKPLKQRGFLPRPGGHSSRYWCQQDSVFPRGKPWGRGASSAERPRHVFTHGALAPGLRCLCGIALPVWVGIRRSGADRRPRPIDGWPSRALRHCSRPGGAILYRAVPRRDRLLPQLQRRQWPWLRPAFRSLSNVGPDPTLVFRETEAEEGES